jgi:hypothetical protein
VIFPDRPGGPPLAFLLLAFYRVRHRLEAIRPLRRAPAT